MSTQPPNGATPQRKSTSIDDLMGQQATAPDGGSTMPPPMPFTPPAAPVPPTPPTAAPAPGGQWKTAAEVNEAHPRRRKPSLSTDGPFIFGFGLLLLLWGGILTFDHFGPTTDRGATVTGVDYSRSRKGGTTYSIEGVDSVGGEFDTDVSKEIYRRADVGDRVNIRRAVLTGRVVAIDGPGWSHDGGRMVWLHGIVATVGLLMLVLGVRSLVKFAAANPDAPRPVRRVLFWLIGVTVAIAAWVFYERSDASAGSGGGTQALVDVPMTTASAAEPAIGECVDVDGSAQMLVPALAELQSISAVQVDLVVDTVGRMNPGCSASAVDAAVCRQLQSALATDPSLTVMTAGRCPGLP
jgi:hypothetical protein